MKNRNLVTMIYIIIIIALILITILNIYNIKKTRYILPEYTIESISEDTIIPVNSYLFFGNYIRGQIDSKELYETIYYFSNTSIPNYFKDSEYSKDNDYIENIDKLYEKLNNIKDLELKLKNIEFIKGEFKQTDENTTALIRFTYNNNTDIMCTIKVNKIKIDGQKNIIFIF